MRIARLAPVWTAAAIGTALAVLTVHFSAHAPEGARCAAGFSAVGASCLVPRGTCPAPLVVTAVGCDAPATRVVIPAASVLVGPSDWEAEGRVAPRLVHADAFALDAFEITVGAAFCPSCPIADPARFVADSPSRAATSLTRDEARTLCHSRDRRGRLPTEDEWVVAASANAHANASNPNGRRYPWGDTGLVCRRAAWGLASGPCATDGTTADTVGAHPAGDAPSGVHDLAGNAAEWVETTNDAGVARGGSWASALAADLRVWSRQEADPDARDPRIGVRCAYAVASDSGGDAGNVAP